MMQPHRIISGNPLYGTCHEPIGRRGVLLVMLLACIVIVSLLTAGLLKGAKQWRQQVRTESRFAQAEWLAESGINRAVSKLSTNQKYAGETWELTREDGLRHPATVTIAVLRAGETQTIRVKTNYKTGFEDGIRAERTLTLKTASGEETND